LLDLEDFEDFEMQNTQQWYRRTTIVLCPNPNSNGAALRRGARMGFDMMTLASISPPELAICIMGALPAD
jgi:hypothetical protein